MAKNGSGNRCVTAFVISMIFATGVILGGLLISLNFVHISTTSMPPKSANINEIFDSIEETSSVEHPRSLLKKPKVIHVPMLDSNTAADYTVPEDLRVVEANYESTFRSCLGANCFAEPVASRSSKNKVRIGLLAPDLSGAEAVLKMLRHVGLNDNDDVEVVLNTHVPAYGYGKNHGWSRIIRLVRRLGPHSNSLLRTSEHSPTTSENEEVLLDAQVRQLMRWHCRLSHVAAHTAMLTSKPYPSSIFMSLSSCHHYSAVFVDDFLRRPVVELERMLTFSGFKAARQDLLAAVAEHQQALMDSLQLSATASSGDTRFPARLYSALTAAMQDEMRASKELTKWPCRSFRELDAALDQQQLRLPMPFHHLSADCSAPHVKCSVRFDTAEQKT